MENKRKPRIRIYVPKNERESYKAEQKQHAKYEYAMRIFDTIKHEKVESANDDRYFSYY